MKTLIQDLRYSLRMLARNPGFTLAAVLTLALGIGANTALFSLIKGVYFESLPYRRAHQIVTIRGGFPNTQEERLPLSGPEFLAIRNHSRLLEHVTALAGASVNLTGQGDPIRIRGAMTTASLFPMLGVEPFLGRVYIPEEQQEGQNRVVVISHRLWQGTFGADPGIIGKTITLNDANHTVIGVMPRRFRYGNNDLWIPLARDLAREPQSRRFIYCHARLKEGASPTAAMAELEGLGRTLEGGSLEREASAAWRVRIARLIDEVLRDVKSSLWVLLGVVGCVLLIACANVSSLVLTRGLARQKEMAIRVALGAGRARIIRQLMMENLLLAIVGGFGGFFLASLSTDSIVRLIPFSYIPIEAEVTVDRTVLFVTLVVALTTPLLFGLMPAWKASRPELSETLKEGHRTGAGAGSRRVRQALVVSQIALTMILLVSAGLMLRSFASLLRVDPGFQPEGLYKMEIALPATAYREPHQVRNFYDELTRRLEGLPGVQGASATTYLPLDLFPSRGTFTIEGRSEEEIGGTPLAEDRQVTVRHLRTLGITLLEGRDFTRQDTSDTPGAAIINHTLAKKYFPRETPLGRRIRIGRNESESPQLTIVGVVKDVKQGRMSDPVLPEIYRLHGQTSSPARHMIITVRSELDQASLMRSARDSIRSMDASLPVFDDQSMEAFIEHSYGAQRLAVFLLGMFGALALVLTVVGIYGVISYSVTRRAREIGLRLALGAQPRDVLKLVVGQGLILAIAGVAMGLVGGLLSTRLMAHLLFGVRATDPATFAGFAGLLILVAVLASYIPARRATKIDPLAAMRCE